MKLFVNGMGASAGGGLTYVRNILPHLSARDDIKTTLALNSPLNDAIPVFANINVKRAGSSRNAFIRFTREQIFLPRAIRESRADVLLSIGNFAVHDSPVPQLLLSRNALYTSADFYNDLRRRGEFRLWLESRIKAQLARRSVKTADLTIAPSHAFAEELRNWTGRSVIALHHGFDSKEFFRDQTPLPPHIRESLSARAASVRLLHVSHYNYYRNFETLFHALSLLKSRMPEQSIKLFLTCRLAPGENPGAYKTDYAARLIRELGIADDVIQLGHVPYSQLHQLYRACHIYVSAAYAESFAHPLVEAMACGLPMAVSDTPVHHEISGNAALFFDRFAPGDLANAVQRLVHSPSLSAELSEQALHRAGDFSWKRHVDTILELAAQAVRVGTAEFATAA